MKRTALARKNSKSSVSSTSRPQAKAGFAICINNAQYPASLEVRKVYRVVTDREAAAHGLLRIVDESGEDYLYSKGYFIPVSLPKPVQRALTEIP
jgi:hypothetical protein